MAVQVLALLAVAYLSRGATAVVMRVLFALARVGAAQVLFWIYTYPDNAVTEN